MKTNPLPKKYSGSIDFFNPIPTSKYLIISIVNGGVLGWEGIQLMNDMSTVYNDYNKLYSLELFRQ